MKSDKEMVPELAKDCDREDCRISNDGSMSSLATMVIEYDKHGFVVPKESNPVVTTYRCRSCLKRWSVHSQAGETRMIVEAEIVA